MAKKIDLDRLGEFKALENGSIATVETGSTASKAYAVGDYFYFKGKLVKATAAITSGGTITLNTNCTLAQLADDLTSQSEKIGGMEYAGAYFDIMGQGSVSIEKRYLDVDKNKVSVRANGSSTAYRCVNLFGTPVAINSTFSSADLSGKTFYSLDFDKDAYGLRIDTNWLNLYDTARNVLYVATKNTSTNEITTATVHSDATIAYKHRSRNLFDVLPAIKTNGNFALFYESRNTSYLNTITYSLSVRRKESNIEASNFAEAEFLGYECFGSGGYNVSTGKATTDNTRIRLKGAYALMIRPDDYVEIESPYKFKILVYSSNVSESTFDYAPTNDFTRSYSFAQSDVGKYMTILIQKEGYESSNISADVSTIQNYVHYYHRVYNGKNYNYVNAEERFYINDNRVPTPNNSVTTATVADTFTNRNARCVVKLPSDYDPAGNPSPLILITNGLHGYVSGDAWNGDTDSTRFGTLITEFTTHGYAVCAANQINGGTDASYDMGCPEQMERYLKLIEYVQNHYNVQDQIMIYGLSQGNFATLNFLKRYPGRIKTALLVGFRASIKAVFDRNDATACAEIATKFGFDDNTGATWEADKVIGEDHYANIVWESSTPYLRYQIPPIKVVTSLADTNDYQVSHDTILALRNGGNRIEWRELATASHGDICVGDGMTEEYRLWFDRFK